MTGPLDPIPVPGASVPLDNSARPGASVARSVGCARCMGGNRSKGGGGPGGHSGFGHISLYMTHPHLKTTKSMQLPTLLFPVNRSFRYSSVPFGSAVKSLLFGYSFQGLS